MATYRITIDMTYSSVSNANTATSNVNDVLTAQGRSETASRSGSLVSLVVAGLSEAEAVALRDLLTPAWGATQRSGGKVSTVRTD